MFRRCILLVATTGAVLTGGLTLAGCNSTAGQPVSGPAGSTGTSSTSAVPDPDAELVAWSDRVCGVFLNTDFISIVGKEPKVDPNSGLAAMKHSVLTYLVAVDDSLGKMISDLRAIGKAPVADGDAALAKLTTSFDQAKSAFHRARTEIEQANPNNPQAFQAAFEQVGKEMSGIAGMEDPSKYFDASAEMNRAADKAPNCKKLTDTTTSAAPTS